MNLASPFRTIHIFSHCSNAIESLLQSCRCSFDVSSVHSLMKKSGLDQDVFLISKLLASATYDLRYAVSIFNCVAEPNIFMFNSLIRACSLSNEPTRAFTVFNNLRSSGIEMDRFPIVSISKICARESNIAAGRTVHGCGIRNGFIRYVDVKNSVLHMYGRCAAIEDACQLFGETPESNDLVSWNTLMSSHLKALQPASCAELFPQLMERMFPDINTLVSTIQAFSLLKNPSGGECVHGITIKIGAWHPKLVSSLIKLYSGMNRVDEGRRLFDSAEERDTVLWNCMISTYANANMIKEAISLLKDMRSKGVKMNSSTFVGVLSACARTASASAGSFVVKMVSSQNVKMTASLSTALITMFAKCGDLKKAEEVFANTEGKDVVCWTAMIAAYGIHGDAGNAVSLFDKMKNDGVAPNVVTFLVVLGACRHCGLLSEAAERVVGVAGGVSSNDYIDSCSVDLLARAGLLKEAYSLARGFPPGDGVVWRALLSAARLYGDVELAQRARDELVALDAQHPSDLLLLAATCHVADSAYEQRDFVSRAYKNTRLQPQVATHWIMDFLK